MPGPEWTLGAFCFYLTTATAVWSIVLVWKKIIWSTGLEILNLHYSEMILKFVSMPSFHYQVPIFAVQLQIKSDF